MATRGSPSGDGVTLPDAVPFDLSPLTRLSWELGARVVDGDESSLQSRWTGTDSSWSLSLFRVTSQTVVIRVRTPIGREQFYGAAQMDLSRALPRLDASPRWRRT
ncbi:hypothetical protein [Haloplanus halobius]|uniref:hypothetical protein n=1 Tax=Haloplanus halobius TaxID=2934938 RepID=UPI00200BBF7B|nr:hypothetical protein [Haloplanus sp. XH21]